MENISIILSDLDGTLFRDDKSIPAFTKEIIRQTQAKGLLFGICTSRAKVNAIQFLEGIEPEIFITKSIQADENINADVKAQWPVDTSNRFYDSQMKYCELFKKHRLYKEK